MAAGDPTGIASNVRTGVLVPATGSDRPDGYLTAAESLVSVGSPRNDQRPGLSAFLSGRRSTDSASHQVGRHVIVTLNSTSRAPAMPSSLNPLDR